MKIIITVILVCLIFISKEISVQAKSEDTYLSEEIQEICVEVGEGYGICPELIMAIIERESSGKADAENGGYKGLMQISDKWHKDRMERLGVTDIFDTYGNILVGTDYLSELAYEYGDVATVLMVYHGEKDAVDKAEKGNISSYASGILERSEELERINGK